MRSRINALILFLLLICILPLMGNEKQSETSSLDSLKILLRHNSNDTAIVMLYYRISEEYNRFNTDSSIIFAQRGIDLALKSGFRRGEALCRKSICVAYYRQGNYPASLDNAIQSLRLGEILQDERIIADNYVTLADVYTDFASDSLGLNFYDKALSIAVRGGFESTIAEIKGSVGLVYARRGDYKKALECYNEDRAICERRGDEYRLALNSLNTGSLYLSKGDYDIALEKLGEGLTRALKINDLRLQAGCLTLMGRYYLGHGEVVKGIDLTMKALRIAQSIKNIQFIRGASLNLYDYYKEKGDFRQALEYFRIGQAAYEESWGEERLRALNNLIYKNEIVVKQNEINYLLKEKRNARQMFAVLGSGILVLLISAVLIIRNRQQLRKVNHVLNSKNVEIEQKSSLLAEAYDAMERKVEERTRELESERIKSLRAILEGQETERERIAQDLHDSLSIRLIGLKRDIEAPGSGTGKAILPEIDAIIGQVRDISHNLMPFALRKFGLIRAVEDLCHSISSDNSFVVHFSPVGIDQGQRWESLIESEIFRIIQELLTNIIKHAGAKKAVVELISDQNMLFLTVEDNGTGFDMKNMPGYGMGLRNINARTQLLGGSISFDTHPGRGTTVMINIPVGDKTINS